MVLFVIEAKGYNEAIMFIFGELTTIIRDGLNSMTIWLSNFNWKENINNFRDNGNHK